MMLLLARDSPLPQNFTGNKESIMRTLFLETILTFEARSHVALVPHSEKLVMCDYRYRTVELPCGCQNRTTLGGGDGLTSLCDDHGVPEDSDDES